MECFKMNTATILLAAGKGTRMRSELLKVLHPLGGKPMVWHTIQAALEATNHPPTLIIGYQGDKVKETFGDMVNYVSQKEQLGTGHAVLQAKEYLKDQSELVLVLLGDMPLLRAETIERLLDTQKQNTGPISLLSVKTDDPRGFGRILRNAGGEVEAIIEEVDCSPDQLAINELNVSMYCFQADWLWENLSKIPVSAKGEYYLTDIVAIARQQGLSVQAEVLEDHQEAMGINTRVHLAEAESVLRERINRDWMLSGVTIIDPATTYIEAEVSIGQDTILYPNTILQGETQVGAGCLIGPNSMIRDSLIGDRCKILASVVEHARMADEVDIGPFGHLRKGAHLDQGVHMGNFGEVKNAYLAPGVKMGHFSYIGDATIGRNVNIGAGTITCNYDGRNKHHTTIEEDVFIGSDTMLVAPLKIGKGAQTGAGSVVTDDIPEGTLVAGVPARNLRKLDAEGE
jgi:bifunctional UDP-N-acetylglucosamine pyrophosphorylase/glucosamine-1-phosphate N-acetyltransferase